MRLLAALSIVACVYAKYSHPPNFCCRFCDHDQAERRVGDVESASPEYELNVLTSKPIIIPLGTDCFAAHALRDLGLRFLAFPFDWGITPAESVLKAISDDFSCFLCDLELDQQAKWTPHFWVRDKRYGFLSAHDFAKEGAGEWMSQVPLVRQKYQRRVDRLLRFLRQTAGTPIYFFRTTIFTTTPNILTPCTPQNWPHDFFALMRLKYPTLNFRLIVAGCDVWLKKPSENKNIIHVYDSQCERFGWSTTPIEQKLPFLRELFAHIDPALTSGRNEGEKRGKVVWFRPDFRRKTGVIK